MVTERGVISVPDFVHRQSGIGHFFGTRHGGVVEAAADACTVVSVKQVHGTDILVLDRPVGSGESIQGGWDALVTNQPAVLLTVRTADCVPVLAYDDDRRVVAAIHSGWRGTVAGIVPKTLRLLAERFGSEPSTLRVAIGPSAGICCYEVDEPVLQSLREGFDDWRLVVQPGRSGRVFLDLRNVIRRQAMNCGVRHDRTYVVDVCTICHPDLFHSYRREGKVNGTMVSGIFLHG